MMYRFKYVHDDIYRIIRNAMGQLLASTSFLDVVYM